MTKLITKKTMPILIAVIALAAIAGLVTQHTVNTDADPYYTYTASVQPYTPGGEMTIIVTANENSPNTISSGTGTARSRTTINVRSLHVLIDGYEYLDAIDYPTLPPTFTVSSGLPTEWTGTCWGFDSGWYGGQCGPFTMLPVDTPYLFTSDVKSAGQTVDGVNVLTIEFIPPELSDGEHTVDVKFFAETLYNPNGWNWYSFNPELTSNSDVNVWQGADYNELMNEELVTTLVIGEAPELTCNEGYIIVSDECVLPTEEQPCSDGYEMVGGVCTIIATPPPSGGGGGGGSYTPPAPTNNNQNQSSLGGQNPPLIQGADDTYTAVAALILIGAGLWYFGMKKRR